MDIGICRLAVIPVRAENSHRSEMVSQLLFGECYNILEKNDDWIHISTINDDYTGWIQSKQHHEVSEHFMNGYIHGEKFRVVSPVLSYNSSMLTMGAVLTEDELPDTLTSVISEKLLHSLPITEKRKFLEKNAFKLMGAPYLWGGRTPFGIDCSGFSQLVYSLIGVQLPRDASQQVNHGTPVDFLSEAQSGDLAFFQNEDGNIVHVGIILENSQIIHSSGQVRIDKIDETGIFNKDVGKYTHYLRIIKKIL